jgi:ATP-dependent RNA helicase DDX24/MAK5
MAQKARLRSLERFSDSKNPHAILVATDVAARGLDIPAVNMVVHYHVPRQSDMYVHRSGRTARAGTDGISVLLCAPEEVQGVRRLAAKVHARNDDGKGAKGKYALRTLDLDRKLIGRLKPRVTLAKKLADHALAKERASHESTWLKTVADELGVDYDSEEFAANEAEGGGGKKGGRGGGRKKKEKEVRELTKEEIYGVRKELEALMAKKVNVGVSVRYLTQGGVDVDELLQNAGKPGDFVGMAPVLGLD